MNALARTRILLWLIFGVLVSPAAVTPASAHHSSAASYEADQSITIKGQVLKFAWTNPHCHVYITVAEGPFKGQTYSVELSSPGALVHDGWTRTLLQPGDDVMMKVHPSRVGASVGLCRNCPLTINGTMTKPRALQH